MSTKFQLSSYDWKSRLVNIAIFFAPVILYVSYQLATLQPVDWKYAYIVGAGLLMNLIKKRYNDHGVPTDTETSI